MGDFKAEVKIGAEIEGLRAGINEAVSSINGLGNEVRSSTESLSSTVNRAGDSFLSLGNMMKLSIVNSGVQEALAGIKSGFEAVTIGGIKVVASFETMQIGISSLIAVNSKNTTALGTHINATEKFKMSQKAAAEAVELLRKANAETPATLAQLTAGFQSALGPAMGLGMGIKETVHYSTLMTQAAAAMGMPMDQLAQEMRSILSGTIDSNSMVAKNIGLTNEQVKAHIKQGDIYQFLISKLSDFGAAGEEMANSWDGSLSNLSNSWDQLRVDIVKSTGIFDTAKEAINGVNKLLKNQHGELDTVIHYTKEATILAGAFYGTVLLGTAIKALSEISLATRIATAVQIAFNAATAINPWVIIAAGVATAVAGLYEYKSLLGDIERDQAKIAGSKNFLADIKGMAGKDTGEKLTETVKRSQALKKEQEQLIATMNEHKKYAYQSSKNDAEQEERKKRIADITEEQKSLVKLADQLKATKAASGGAAKQDGLVSKPAVTEEDKEAGRKAKQAADRAAKEAARAAKAEIKEAERTAKEIERAQDELTQSMLDGYDKRVDKAADSYRDDIRSFGNTAQGKLIAQRKFDAEIEAAGNERDAKLKAEADKKLEKDREAKIQQLELEKQAALSKLQIEADNLESSRAQHKITESQMLEGLKIFEGKKFDIEIASAIKRKALFEGDVEKIKAANDRIIALEQKKATAINKSSNDIATQSNATYSAMMTSITESVGSSIGNVLNGTMSVKNASKQILNDMLGMFTQFIGKQIAAHLMGEETMTLATMTGNATRMASNIWAGMVSIATTVGEAIARIGAYAAIAAAGAYAAIASIPVVGPFLAPAAAIGALVAVGALVNNIASAEGGYDIPNGVNPMTQLHQNEMVLPAEHANTIRNLSANGGGGGSNITIHAVDSKSIKDLFMAHGPALVDSIKNQSRNFNR